MKIIYYSHYATYGAYGMAAIHTGLYKEEGLPCLEDIQKQWELCFAYGSQPGNLIYMGLDEELREIYILGCGNHGWMVEKAYNAFGELLGIEEEHHYIDASRWEGSFPHLMSLSTRHSFMEPMGQKAFVLWFKGRYGLWTEKVQEEKINLLKGIKI